MYQIQNKKPKLIVYTSKGAKNYSIIELKMYGLAISIASFVHLLKMKPTEIPIQEVPRNLSDLHQEINIDFKENSTFKRV